MEAEVDEGESQAGGHHLNGCLPAMGTGYTRPSWESTRITSYNVCYTKLLRPVRVVLRHKDVRKTAHNWKTFQSGAEPGRIVVPSEVAIRNLRQIPFEVDPPEHKGYRELVEPWFKRPLEGFV